MAYEPAIIDALTRISTATITTILIKRGLRNVWIRAAAPLQRGARKAGPAFTLRFVPAREDLASPAAWASPTSTRAAIEDMPEGVIAVIDAAGGVAHAGVFGDILCQRMAVRKVAGLVTDGVVRDLVGVEATGLPVWCAGAAAPPSVTGLTFVGWQQPVACGGVAVFPDDMIVADDDGAVVIPAALVAETVAEGLAQEAFEAWVVDEVRAGRPLLGLYPPNAETQARYEAFKAKT